MILCNSKYCMKLNWKCRNNCRHRIFILCVCPCTKKVLQVTNFNPIMSILKLWHLSLQFLFFSVLFFIQIHLLYGANKIFYGVWWQSWAPDLSLSASELFVVFFLSLLICILKNYILTPSSVSKYLSYILKTRFNVKTTIIHSAEIFNIFIYKFKIYNNRNSFILAF